MSGLTSSMWSSVSGLIAHGDRMGVISNQIANVNTVGFKGSRMDFADLMSSYVGTTSGVGQVGRGVRPGVIMADFSEGSIEGTTSATDVAIAGNGFFKVKPKNSNTDFYTRAGNFLFDRQGFLTDPNGYVLQGWKIDHDVSQASSTGKTVVGSSGIVGSGVPQDIRLDTFTCDPKHTNNITTALNLDSAQGNDRTENEDNPFFSLLTTWDATNRDSRGNIVPLGTNAYAHQHTIEVFDEGGQSHEVSIYFDRVEKTIMNDITGLEESNVVWEYIVTMDPADDKRDFDGDGTTLRGTKHAGLLMAGTLNFNSAGQMEDMTAYVPNGGTDSDMGDLSTWVQAPISTNGYPMFAPNFTGREGASTAWDNTTVDGISNPTGINRNTDGYLIEMNFGLKNTSSAWQGNSPNTIAGWVEQPAGEYKPLKSDKSEGTLVTKVGEDNKEAGIVGKDGIVYKVVTSPDGTDLGTNKVWNDQNRVVYHQKHSDADSIGTDEAKDTDGYIYEQLTKDLDQVNIGGTGNLVDVKGAKFYTDSPDVKFFYYKGEAYLEDGTAHAVTGKAEKVADPTKPVRSNRPVVEEPAEAILRYNSSGDPIQKTTTHNFSGMGVGADRESTSTTSYTLNTAGGNFYDHATYQDGYTYGDLRYTNISSDGVLTGTYSNGVTLQLFQITLYDFQSKQNLHREGNNLFTETRESGVPTSGAAGSGTFGKTESYNLEGSNVDLSRELVNMITTQRGFQANSKSITTVDTMLETVIGMKR